MVVDPGAPFGSGRAFLTKFFTKVGLIIYIILIFILKVIWMIFFS